MFKINTYPLLVLGFIWSSMLFSQDCDTAFVTSLINKSYSLNTHKPDSALKLALNALERAKACGEKRSLEKAYFQAGSSYDYLNRVDSALECYKMYLSYAITLKDSSSIALAYNMIGSIYIYKADYPKALTWCMNGLKLAEKIKNENILSRCLGNIGNVYYFQRHYEQALAYWQQGLTSAKKMNDVKNIVIYLGNIGAYYNEKEDFENAVKYLNESLSYTIKNNDKHGSLAAYTNIGNAYMFAGNYDKALQYYTKGEALAEELNDRYNKIVTLNDIGDTYINLRRYDEAEKCFMRALAVDKEFAMPQGRLAANFGLFTVNDSLGRHKKAISYLLRYKDLKDSILSVENQQQINELETKYQSEKKEQENKLLNAKNTLAEQTIKNQKNLTIFLVLGLLLALLLTLNVYRGFRQKKKDNLIILSQKEEVELRNSIIEHQKAVVEEKQKEILDSIHYAKRIQQALLASESYIERTINRLTKGKF